MLTASIVSQDVLLDASAALVLSAVIDVGRLMSLLVFKTLALLRFLLLLLLLLLL